MKKKWLFITLIAAFVISCNIGDVNFDNLEVERHRPIVAIPLGEVTYTIQQLFNRLDNSAIDILEDEETGLFTFVYTDTLSYDQNDIISIEDVLQEGSFPLPPATAQTALTVPPFVLQYESTAGEEITQVDYSAGQLQVRVDMIGQGRVDYRIEIQNTFNIASNQTVNFLNSTTQNTQGVNTINNLNGYRTTLNTGSGQNNFTVSLTDVVLVLDPGEQTVAGDALSISVSYTNQEFEIIYGRFGSDTLDLGTESIDLSFFAEIGTSGELIFENPQMIIDVENYLGVSMGLSLANITAVKFDSVTNTSETFRLGGQVTQSPQLVRSAPLDNLGQFERSIITIENRNSTIRSFFGNAPDEISFNITAISNPPVTAQGLNYLIPSSTRVNTSIELRLPMAMQIRNIQRDLEFELPGSLEALDITDSVSLRIVTENLLPFNTRMEFQILDEIDSILYRVPNTLVIATPFLNADRVANEKQTNISNISLSEEGVRALQSGSKVKMILTLNTPQALNSNDIYPKFLSRYAITVKLSVAARLDREITL